MFVECVVGSHLAPKVFLWVLRLSSLHKNQQLQIQFDQNRGAAWKLGTADAASLIFYFFSI